MLIVVNYLVVFAVWGALLLIGPESVLEWAVLPLCVFAALAGLLNAAASYAVFKRREDNASSVLEFGDRNYLFIVALVTFGLVLEFRSALAELSDPTNQSFVSGSLLFQIGLNFLLLVLVRIGPSRQPSPLR